ncbi:MAG: nitroreductase family protein [Steroidobacteraceae bacterium]
MDSPSVIALPERPPQDDSTMLAQARAFASRMHERRSVRDFDSRPVPRALIEACLHTAGSAPSGANQQPWHFVAVSDLATKQRIRTAAEAEEREFYARRAPKDWLDALRPIGTDAHKPFLEVAPWLIVIFLQRYARDATGGKIKHYYTDESVGIATGMLISALHLAGLATLTHTPSPMGFLNEILARPRDTERPYLVLVTGYPAPGCTVPAITRKPLEAIYLPVTRANLQRSARGPRHATPRADRRSA